MIKAELKNYRQSPRKVRLVADLVRGKDVGRAISELTFLNKKASLQIKKLVESAIANAKHNFKLEKENLFIKEIRVDEGPTLKRFRAGARGVAYPMKKRTSRVIIGLEEKNSGKAEKVEVVREKVKKTEKTAKISEKEVKAKK
ncbi:50S ribosomal protein L22 [Patescibacteria group bacterium]|nr:50S ribosomal protein L22 [Patescibacteria group bacterium]